MSGSSTFTTLTDKIFYQDFFLRFPPVLIDVGASYHIHPIWKEISKYSICLAFDPDLRETDYLMEEDKGYLKLYTLPYIVSSEKGQEMTFFLTDSPYCSSTLRPATSNLSNYSFRQMFEIKKEIKLPSKTLDTMLSELSLDRVDWLKTDTQGTDLRIFENIPFPIKEKMCAIDFEPGLIDAYEGEDKLHHILKEMEKYPFWIADLEVKGVPRITTEVETQLKPQATLRTAPCWSEITYFNNFLSNKQMGEREFFLGWIFSTLLNHHGFSYKIALDGMDRYKNKLFQECITYTQQALEPKQRTLKEKILDRTIHLLNQLK